MDSLCINRVNPCAGLFPTFRTAEGYIERVSFAIYNSPHDVLYPYIYEQRLLGWPEPKVFWAAKSGPCIGVAPVTRASSVS